MNGVLVTAAALGLVAFAFQSGLHLVTEDLPSHTFASRWLAQIGVTRG